jgi:hypothetical protein
MPFFIVVATKPSNLEQNSVLKINTSEDAINKNLITAKWYINIAIKLRTSTRAGNFFDYNVLMRF